MKKINLVLLFSLLMTVLSFAQGYDINDKVADFSLKNIDGKMVALDDFTSQKGVIVIFTCNHCPYAVAYEDRIIALDQKYKALGFPVLAINPNDAEQYPSDSFEEMKVRAKEKGFTFPYVVDDKQVVFPQFGATKTPHIYLLENQSGDFVVRYIGAIDDSVDDEKAVTKHYLADAIDALIAGENPQLTKTKAIGCSIKVKQ